MGVLDTAGFLEASTQPRVARGAGADPVHLDLCVGIALWKTACGMARAPDPHGSSWAFAEGSQGSPVPGGRLWGG